MHGDARSSTAAAKSLTAETQRPQRKNSENRLLCELRVSAVKNVRETPSWLAKDFRHSSTENLMPL